MLAITTQDWIANQLISPWQGGKKQIWRLLGKPKRSQSVGKMKRVTLFVSMPSETSKRFLELSRKLKLNLL
jgi:hypothetical protein